MSTIKSLCEYRGLYDKTKNDMWVVGSCKGGIALVYKGTLDSTQVKTAYAKETKTNYFDVRATRLQRFLKKTPDWFSM